MSHTRKPIVPSFRIALKFPDGTRYIVESRKDVNWTPFSWCDAAMSELNEYRDRIGRYRRELAKAEGQS